MPVNSPSKSLGDKLADLLDRLVGGLAQPLRPAPAPVPVPVRRPDAVRDREYPPLTSLQHPRGLHDHPYSFRVKFSLPRTPRRVPWHCVCSIETPPATPAISDLLHYRDVLSQRTGLCQRFG